MTHARGVCDVAVTIRRNGHGYDVEYRASASERVWGHVYLTINVEVAKGQRQQLGMRWKRIRQTESNSDSERDAEWIGCFLFDTFLRKGLQDWLAHPSERIRIELHVDDRWLSALPWEMICHRTNGVTRFLSREGHSVVRGLSKP